ncbi:MAG: VOC family protein [Bacteroidota bacterium]
MRNPVNWFEIAAIDLDRAKDFYANVFNAEFEFVPMPDSPMYMFAGDPEAPNTMGALVKSKENIPSKEGTLIYFQCEDLANEEARVAPNGGQVIMPKTSIGEFGFIAQFIDTEGNRIGLHSQV